VKRDEKTIEKRRSFILTKKLEKNSNFLKKRNFFVEYSVRSKFKTFQLKELLTIATEFPRKCLLVTEKIELRGWGL
jgi:hypothetical protein